MHNPFAQKRSTDLDFLRVAAAIAVIVIHCAAILVLGRDVDSKTWMFGNIMDSFMRWSVPVFVMISGALLIKEKAFKEQGAFLKKRFGRVLLPLVAWPVIYAVWATIAFNSSALERLWFGLVAGDPYPGHLYFLFLIAGLYVLTPAISLYVAHVSRRQLWATTLIILAGTALWHAAEFFYLRGGAPLSFLTQALPYIGYYLLGYLLWHTKTTPRTVRIMAVAFFVGSGLIALFTYLMVKHLGIYQGYYFYSFPSALVMVVAPAAFICGRAAYAWAMGRIRASWRKKIEAVLPVFAATTFGIYLVHLLILKAIAIHLPIEGATIKSFLFLVPSVLICSYVATWLLLKVPFVRRLVA